MNMKLVINATKNPAERDRSAPARPPSQAALTLAGHAGDQGQDVWRAAAAAPSQHAGLRTHGDRARVGDVRQALVCTGGHPLQAQPGGEPGLGGCCSSPTAQPPCTWKKQARYTQDTASTATVVAAWQHSSAPASGPHSTAVLLCCRAQGPASVSPYQSCSARAKESASRMDRPCARSRSRPLGETLSLVPAAGGHATRTRAVHTCAC